MHEKFPFGIQSGSDILSGSAARQWVPFGREFRSKFKGAVSVTQFHINRYPTGNFQIIVGSINISEKGRWMELEENGQVKSITSSGMAHTV